MQISTNRYYKDSQSGYRFQLETGIFADRVLTDDIGRGLIGRVIGNRSVNCWLGGLVKDTRERQYYVFGHNRMVAQERESNRLSCLFTFVIVPFESLYQVGSASELMSELSRMEMSPSGQPHAIPVRSGYQTGSQIDDRIADALAACAVEQSVPLELFDSMSGCTQALDTIWRASLFARCMPIVSLMDERSPEQPQYGWKLFPGSGERCITGGNLQGRHVTPENAYLYYAYGYAMKFELEKCRNAMSLGEITRLSREFGSSNDKVLEQLLLWYYAMNRRMEMLPTEEEKAAILKIIR